MRPDHAARGVRVLGIWPAVLTGRQPLTSAEGAEVVVEGVVLHHQHDDVLNLRQYVGADRARRVWPVARPVAARPKLPLPELLAFNPLPGSSADHVSPPSAVPLAPRTRVRPPSVRGLPTSASSAAR